MIHRIMMTIGVRKAKAEANAEKAGIHMVRASFLFHPLLENVANQKAKAKASVVKVKPILPQMYCLEQRILFLMKVVLCLFLIM